MRCYVVFVALLLAGVANADELTDSRKLQREALEAHRAGDEKAFLARIGAASALRPQHPSLLYQLAMAQAVNGSVDSALATLERVAAMGFIYKPETAREFASLQDSQRFRDVVARFAENAKPHGKPVAAFGIDRTGLIAEGMAYDERTRRFFVSSVHTNSIFAIDSRGRATPFVTGARWGIFGMAVDRRRNVLWAATSALPQTAGFRKEDEGKAAVLKIALTSGKVLATLAPDDGGKHTFGDVAIAANGDVLVSDSASPVIYKVDGDRLEPFITGPFSSMQGIAATRKWLYVADYARGIFAVDRGAQRLLDVPSNVSLLGVDGLYAAGPNMLIATQNGTNPNRVIRVALTADGLHVKSVETIAANDPAMRDLTLGVVAGSSFYFNANAQWDAWGDDGAMVKDAKLEPLRVMRVRLSDH
jgi:hypothetical protein